MSVLSLAEIQQRMQEAILAASPSDNAIGLIARPATGSAETRLETYRSAYRIRLLAILREDFDALHEFLGDTDFDMLAAAYLEAHPSHTPDARWFGDGLAAFAASATPFAAHPVIAELAALQWALGKAFDAHDAPAATIDDLAAVPADHAAELAFAFHPCVSILTRTTNAAEILTALRSGSDPVAPETVDDGALILVWRAESRARYRVLEAEEAMLAREAASGASFALLCEMAAMMRDDGNAAMRVAGVLRTWLESGIVSELRVQS
ncbi:MAG: putative DNA-binding domain-containing protein [Notoacmeibacter sp.]|nr:putative DNA-binding domain-containing protein [Notoacmeibacter sp.]MCC0032957.1 putative DNA-binding domain-containing protein [Brucellaceae bacterium]